MVRLTGRLGRCPFALTEVARTGSPETGTACPRAEHAGGARPARADRADGCSGSEQRRDRPGTWLHGQHRSQVEGAFPRATKARLAPRRHAVRAPSDGADVREARVDQAGVRAAVEVQGAVPSGVDDRGATDGAVGR